MHFLTASIAGLRLRLKGLSKTPSLHANPDRVRSVATGPGVLGAGSCYVCGGIVEEGLARLGSTLCHDCRRGHAQPEVHARV
jgi:hypothetical protein